DGEISLLELRPDLPALLARVILRAMDPDPERRFPSVSEMAVALAETGERISAPISVPVHAPSGKGRRVTLAVAAALALGGAGYVWHVRSPNGGAPAAVHERYDRAHDLVQHYYRPKAVETAISLLEAITREAPGFAASWADLGRANFLQFWQLRDTRYVE